MAYEPELERLERRYQDDPARYFAQLAEAYRRAGRLDDALTMLQGHLTDRPNYVSGLVVLGRCLVDQQNDADARATFERVLGVDSEHIIALRALGEIAERAGDPDGARGWFTRLLDVDPMNEDAEQALRRLSDAAAAPRAAERQPPAPELVPEPPPAVSTVPERSQAQPPVTFPVPRVEDAKWGGRSTVGQDAETAATRGAEAAAPEAPPREPEFLFEQSNDQFMPRPSGAHPRDVEPIGDLEFTSRLQEEESPIGAVPDIDVPDSLPLGEREVDLGFADTRGAADQPAELGAARAPGSPPEMGITPFDDALGWGAGDRISRQISDEDLKEIEHTHEQVAPVSELLGLERSGIPDGDAGAEVGAVEGLGGVEPGTVHPLAGLEATAGGGIPAEESIEFVEPEPPALEVANEAVVPVVPEVALESDGATMDASGVVVDRATAERRASLIGLPLLEGADTMELEEPLVLEAEPEPVVTETMAELYVRQGLFDEARDVYERLLAQRPGDSHLKARLGGLRADAALPRAPVQYDAAKSGGRSARAMMMAVLAARPGLVGGRADAAVAMDRAVPAAPAADSLPAGGPAPAPPEPMDEAFGEELGDAAFGAPTQPADDEVTLSAIFGEPSLPAVAEEPARLRPTEPKAAAARAPGGFSFDEFFGKPTGSAPVAGGRPHRDTLSDDEGEEAFRDWLKGLKG